MDEKLGRADGRSRRTVVGGEDAICQEAPDEMLRMN